MAEPKWTSGPWSRHGNKYCPCGQIFGADGNAVVAIAQGPHDLSLDGPDCVPNEIGQAANMALIAAAPDLYMLLCEARLYVADAGGDEDPETQGRAAQSCEGHRRCARQGAGYAMSPEALRDAYVALFHADDQPRSGIASDLCLHDAAMHLRCAGEGAMADEALAAMGGWSQPHAIRSLLQRVDALIEGDRG